MTTVVDASVLVAALTDYGNTGNWAGDLVAEGELAGPELLLVEAINVLRRLEQSHHISLPEATSAYSDLVQLEIDFFSFAPFSERVWGLRHNLTGYDAWYVALAEALNCPLATLDLRLSRATGPTCQVITPPASQTANGAH